MSKTKTTVHEEPNATVPTIAVNNANIVIGNRKRVVKNDTDKSSASASADAAPKTVKAAITKLKRMAAESEAWANKELAASHRRLYSILTDCYAYYLTMKTAEDKDIRDNMRRALKDYITTNNLDIPESANDMTRIVKSIFGVDRRRASAYSIALRAALMAGGVDTNGRHKPIAATALADWLMNNGGVEEIRLGNKTGGMTPKLRAEKAAEVLKTTTLMAFKPDPRTMPFGVDDIDRAMLLIVTYRPTGELEVSSVVKTKGAVDAAMAAYYSAEKKNIEANAAKAKTAEQQRDSATALAMQQLALQKAA
jgi:hypothetical protein